MEIQKRRIEQLLKERRMTKKDLAMKMEVTSGYISQILSPNPTRGIGIKTLTKIADIFHVPVDALLRDEETTGLYPAARQQNQKVPIISWIRVPDWTATSARYLASQPEETISFDTEDPTAFAVRLPNSELEPMFRPGDVLIISPIAVPRDNEWALISDVDRIKVRRIANCDGTLVMTTDRGAIETQLNSKTLRIIGKIAGRISRF